MKKITSLFVVALLLVALSVSTFAEVYGSTTVEDGKIDEIFDTRPSASWDGVVTEDGCIDFGVEASTTYYVTPESTKDTMSAAFSWKMDMYFYGTEDQPGNGSTDQDTNKFVPYASAFTFLFGGETNQAYIVTYDFDEQEYKLIYNPYFKKIVFDDEDKWMLDEKNPQKFEQVLISKKEELTMNEWHEVVFQVYKNGEVRLFVDDEVKIKYTDPLMGSSKDPMTGEDRTYPITVDPKISNVQKIFRKFNLQMKIDNMVLGNDEYYDFHTFDESKAVVVPAKEFEDGSITQVCEKCGEVCVTTLPALGCQEHKGGKATCTAKAVCEKCGVKYGKMTDHTWGSKVTVESVATSLKEGRSYVTCSVCGAKKYTITILDPNNPDPSDPIYKDGYVDPGPGGDGNGDNNEPGENPGTEDPNEGGSKKDDDDKTNPGTADMDIYGLATLVSAAGLALILKKRV